MYQSLARHRYLKALLFALVLLPAATSLGAADDADPTLLDPLPIAGVLGLEDALARAQNLNPDLVVIRQEIDATAAQRLQASLRPNPTATYDIEEVRGGGRGPGLVVSIPLEFGGKRAARISFAEQAQAVAGAEVALRSLEVRAAVIHAFFAVLIAQERESLARASSEVATRGLDIARRRVQAGRVSPVDETRARVVLSSSTIELSQALTDLVNARRVLGALLAQPEQLYAVTLPTLASLPLAPDIVVAEERITRAPEVRRARAEVLQRDAARRLAQAQAFPAVSLNVGSRTLVENGERANLIGVQVAVPIFDRNQGNIREAAVRMEQAQDRVRAVEIRLRAEVLQARQRLAAARREVDLFVKEILPDAESALTASTRGFELGRFGFLDVLEAQRALFTARAQLVRVLGNAYGASADLERLLGPANEVPTR